MNFSKYKNLLFAKMKTQFSQWFATEANERIPNAEVYRFVHSVKGTAGTLQLGGLHQLAEALLNELREADDKHWSKEDLTIFLYEIIRVVNGYEQFHETDRLEEHKKIGNLPLIQIIDDDVSMLILLKDVLEKQGWMVIASSTPEKAISQFFDLNPDCVIIDVKLPNKSGFEVIQELQAHSSKLFVPFIMISVMTDRKTRINAYKMGADDFLGKPLDLEELTVHVERHLQRKRIYDQSVMLDELTNLYNRRFLKDVFTRSINDLKRNGQIFSLAIIDIDFFKKINDTYGHLTGDTVLSEFARFLNEKTRSTDLVFRYGGEEFMIIFPNTNHLQAYEIVSRILDYFSKTPIEANGTAFRLTFSAGVTTIDSVETTLEEALSLADQAVYKAKETGRAKVESISNTANQAEKRKLFISVIDDDTIIRKMLIGILEKMKIAYFDVEIRGFENGLSFLESNRLFEHGEHFLILDGVMPIMDGLELLQKVKQTENGKSVMVMMLTGRKSNADISRALQLGADDYMTKPFRIIELQERIQRLIERMK
ncbi:diguanylate cyclase [Neobacillus sp. SM06]|uniref:diguanylate cyclase n=1 Tax=Neobacillus sp. SM06 TaxID=3422492 RepID=UPI003D2A4D2F